MKKYIIFRTPYQHFPTAAHSKKDCPQALQNKFNGMKICKVKLGPKVCKTKLDSKLKRGLI